MSEPSALAALAPTRAEIARAKLVRDVEAAIEKAERGEKLLSADRKALRSGLEILKKYSR